MSYPASYIPRTKPTKWYKSFQDFYSRHSTNNIYNWPYPCVECEGYGKIRDPDCLGDYDYRPDWIECSHCNGSGKGSRSKMRKAYQEVVAEYNLSMEIWTWAQEVHQRVGRKLRSYEKDVLRVLGIPK